MRQPETLRRTRRPRPGRRLLQEVDEAVFLLQNTGTQRRSQACRAHLIRRRTGRNVLLPLLSEGVQVAGGGRTFLRRQGPRRPHTETLGTTFQPSRVQSRGRAGTGEVHGGGTPARRMGVATGAGLLRHVRRSVAERLARGRRW